VGGWAQAGGRGIDLSVMSGGGGPGRAVRDKSLIFHQLDLANGSKLNFHQPSLHPMKVKISSTS
jgi:hypothetical protein